MMALVAHQTKGYSALAIRTQRSGGVHLRCSVAFHFGRTNRFASLRHHFQFRGQPITLPKERPFRVSSFKSNGQHDEANDTNRKSKISKKTVHVSYEAQKREETSEAQKREETFSASPDITSTELFYASENRAFISTGPQAIQRLFKKWLIMLRSEPLIEAVDVTYTGSPVHGEILENEEVFNRQKDENVLKTAFLFFMRLDATIKIPLLIFVPWYFIIRVVYGHEVTKELTPLWVLGPLITAVYIKLIEGLYSLYLFCFKQSIRFLEIAPDFYRLIYSCVAEGKLQALLYAHCLQPIVDVRSMDYNALTRQKLKELKQWAFEEYLDYAESIWPYYCRTIRFLKKANLL